MGTGETLLARIFQDLADTAARLVYADWLLERGDARGELIHLQCKEQLDEREQQRLFRFRSGHEAFELIATGMATPDGSQIFVEEVRRTKNEYFFKNQGWTIVGGAGRAKEEWIRGSGPGRTGGVAVDITATKDGQTLRIQTIDTLVDKETPDGRESRNAARIRAAFPNDRLILIPKLK